MLQHEHQATYICLTINNITFQFPLLDCQDSTDVAERELYFVFQQLHFGAFVGRDLTVDDIRITAEDFAAKDHSQLDAFTGIFFILSYGDSNDVILGVNGGTISIAELVLLLTKRVSNAPKQIKASFHPGLKTGSKGP